MHVQYKEPLSDVQRTPLVRACASIDCKLLVPAMRNYAVDFLRQSSSYASSEPIYETLKSVEVDDGSGHTFSDFAWLDRDFPKDLTMAQWIATYEMILECVESEATA